MLTAVDARSGFLRVFGKTKRQRRDDGSLPDVSGPQDLETSNGTQEPRESIWTVKMHVLLPGLFWTVRFGGKGWAF